MGPLELTGTSFSLILFNASLNIYSFWRRGQRAEQRLVWAMGLGVACGTPLGSLMLGLLSARTFEILFGLVLLILALRNQFSLLPEASPTAGPTKIDFRHPMLGLTIGLVAGLTGIGGGTLILPALMLTTALPLARLSLHSHFIMLFAAGSGISFLLAKNATLALNTTTLPGLSALSFGPVHLGPVLLLMVGALPATRFGVYLLGNLKQNHLKSAFTIFLAVLAVRFLFP